MRSDPYKAFVLHAVIENSDSYVLKDNLYEAYKKHCKMHKLGHKSRDSFFKNFKDLFPLGKINTERPEIDGKRVWVFRGIRLREEANWCKPLTEEETEAKVELGGGAKGGQKRQNGRPEGQGVLTVQGEAPHLAKINELEKKLKEYLEAHNGIEALSTVYSLFGEWLPGTERPDLQELIDQIKEGHRFNFNYASQNVSLVKEAIRNEYPR